MPEKEKIEKIRLKDIKLSEEITKNRVVGGKLDKIIKLWGEMGINFNIFISEIPYKEFKIILVNSQPPKNSEDYYYRLSKYGWWNFCAKKDNLDSWDKKLTIEKANHYGRYREDDHTFCNDNMEGGEYLYNLRPNEMVEIVKKSIDKFHKDKEELTKSAERRKD